MSAVMKRTCFFFASVFLWAPYANTALAETHERVTVSEWVEKGDVVGIKVKLTLRPKGVTQVRVGLGDQSKQAIAKLNSHDSSWRKAAAGVSGSFIVHSFGEVKGVTARTPKQVEFSVRYSDAPNLTPGQNIEVVTAWKKPNYWHIHGAETPLYRQSVTYKLPQLKAGSRLGKVASTKTPVKPTRTSSRRTPAARPKPKPRGRR